MTREALPSVVARALPSLAPAELERLAALLEPVSLAAGATIVAEGERARDLYFVVAGEATVSRRGVRLRRLSAGESFGELALVTGRPRAATIVATAPLELARLSRERYEALAAREPDVARRVLEDLIGALGVDLRDMTDGVSQLISERSLRPQADVRVKVGERELRVPVGTTAGDVLASAASDPLAGGHVVAALLDGKAVSLHTQLVADTTLAPLLDAGNEGRRVRRQTAGLLLLEAAARVAPGVEVALGATIEGGQVVHVSGPGAGDPGELAARITGEMDGLVAANAPVRLEVWAVDEARAELARRGSSAAAALLRTARDSNVPLVTAGRFLAIAPGPLLTSFGGLEGAKLVARGGDGLVLVFGDEPFSAEPPPKDAREMARAHETWLGRLGATSVGAFNELCVTGQVSEIIRVAEGFHEKRLGTIADRIAARRGTVKVICVAGPSSAGKTTFIKRLDVQLRVNGLNPIGVSLDDYYLDRDKSPRDASGEYDFERLEALDIARLGEDLRRMLGGKTVRTPRFDFVAGKSVPEKGPVVRLRSQDVLLLEGIHGLNPRLLSGALTGDEVFRVFLDPTTTLRFDALTRMNASDLRLIRRIVRDRFRRGGSTADNIARWTSVRDGERRHIFPFAGEADATFDTALIYEPAVLKVYADRYLLEVPRDHPSFATAHRLRLLIDRFVTIYPDHVPPTSILREFIGGSGFEY